MASPAELEVRRAPTPPRPLDGPHQGYGHNQGILTYEEIASKLLSERLLLTALELHTELCEADRELPVLRDFFSNPNNFECLNMKPEPCIPMPRSSSQATLDSLDMTRYSEDGGGVDERVAVLEFELRKAKENISSLRANLTVVTESEVSTPDKSSEKHGIFDHPIKPHEQRTLNFLVNEYLLANSYKLTPITFSDENENQDFEDAGCRIKHPETFRSSSNLQGIHERMAQSIKVMFAIAIFITYALQAYVPVEIAWSTYIDHRVKENKVFWEYVIRTIVTLATFILAISVPRLGLFISLFGALCLSALGIAFPAIIEICVLWPNNFGPCKLDLYKNYGIIIFGCIGLVVGTYVSLIDIIHSFE